jgi:hypothetical protein
MAEQQAAPLRLREAEIAPELIVRDSAPQDAPSGPLRLSESSSYEPSLGTVLGTAATNFPSSAYNVLTSMVEPILSPVETAKAIGQLGEGAYSKVKGKLGFSQDPEEKARQEAAIDAVGAHFADRYGSREGFRKAFMEDPAGIMMDLSTVLTGGGALVARTPALAAKVGQVASKVPGAAQIASTVGSVPGAANVAATIGKGVEELGEAAQTIGRAVDPFSLGLKVTEKGIEGAGKLAAVPISLKSGASIRSLQHAVDAGLTQNVEFVRHLSGQGSTDEVVQAVQDAIRTVAKERSDDYLSRMKGPRASTVPLDFNPVLSELATQYKNMSHLKGPTSALSEAYAEVGSYQQRGLNTIADFDRLKQRLDEIRQSYPQDSRSQAAITAVRQQVYKTIAGRSPEYARAMEAYQTASKKLDELKAELAGNRNATVSQQMRKILKAQKSPFGSSLLDDLDRLNPDLKYMIAGQELSQVLPVGTVRQAIIGGMLPAHGSYQAMAGLDPTLMAIHAATLPFASPIVGGSVLGATGLAAGVPARIGEVYGKVPSMVRYAPYQAGTVIEEAKEGMQERPQRKAGGRVTTASQLIASVERAKQRVNNTTKPLMRASDDQIARALAIANRHLEG